MQAPAIRTEPRFRRDLIEQSPSAPNRFALLELCLSQTHPDGMILEFGVHKGETIDVIAASAQPRTVYGFDSFEGLPEDWNVSSRDWKGGMKKGDFGPGPDAQYRIAGLPRTAENVELVQGWFNDSLPEFLENHDGPCAFIHMDCDLYSSATTVLDCLKPRMTVGTIIQFDEFYNFVGFEEHEMKAFYEFIERTGFGFEYLGHCPALREDEEQRGDDRTDRQIAVRITSV